MIVDVCKLKGPSKCKHQNSLYCKDNKKGIATARTFCHPDPTMCSEYRGQVVNCPYRETVEYKLMEV